MIKTPDLRDVLEEEIVTGVLRPGHRLDEVSLATRFGVSRTPVRQALFQLAASGLVESRPRKGTFVLDVGPRQLMEMFDVMAELEGMCARMATRRASEEDLRLMSDAHTQCEQAIRDNDVETYYYRNETFHELIRQASQHRFLMEQADVLQRRLKPYRRLQLRNRGRLRTSFEEHTIIINAIVAGDAELADNTMRDHVAIQGERFTDLLASLELSESALRARG